jgi:hypothetical protein
MIKIEITHANLEDHKGVYDFYKNIVYFGKNHDAEFYLPHSNLISNHLFIEIVENKLIAQIHKDVDYIIVNKKRTTQFKHLKHGDLVELSDIKFKILDFSYEELIQKIQVLNDRVKAIQRNDPDLLELISSLSEEV